MHRPNFGFTLIELMIVVAIVAILASIAYPSYQNQILRSRRADGKTALMQNAQALEKCFTVNGTYVGCASLVATSGSGYYNIAAPVAGATGTLATSFSMTATPTGSQASDTYCATLTIDSIGTRTATNSDCWTK